MMESATNVAQNTLSSLKMSSGRRSHELTQLTHTEGKIRPGKGQVLKGTNHTVILRKIIQGNTIMRNQSFKMVARTFSGLSILHVEPVKNICSIFCLCKSETKVRPCYLDAKKVMKGTKVLDLKRRTKSSNERSNMKGLVTCDDDIIYIEQ